MNRLRAGIVSRGVLKSLLVVVLLITTPAAEAQTYEPNWTSLDTRPTPGWFSDAKFGIFIHWGLYSVPAYAPVGIPKEQPYAEWYWNSMTVGRQKTDPHITATWKFHQQVYGQEFRYEDFAPRFKAELFDPSAWADLFQRSGAKYVVLTAKHHDGFALWPSAEASREFAQPWNSMEAGPHRDLVGDLTTAVRARGLKMGLYYSLYEWYDPLWLTNKPDYVSKHMVPQFKDLVTRYQPSVLFTDGQWDLSSDEWHSQELLAWMYNQPSLRDEIVVNDRWGKDTGMKHGGYWTTEYTSGMAESNHPWEENRGMGFSYGYNRAEKLDQYHSGRDLVLMLADTVSRGGNLLLDIGPEADGSIPVIMEERLTEIGAWLRVNGEAIYGTHAVPASRLYGSGKLPATNFNQTFQVTYNIAQLVDRPEPGTALLNGFFTAKGDSTFVILTHWKAGSITLPSAGGKPIHTVTLLGAAVPLQFKDNASGLTVTLPELPASLRSQPAWTLKLQP